MALPAGVSRDSSRAVYETLIGDGIRLGNSGLATYFYNTSGYTGYSVNGATTDMLTISGADGMIVRIFVAQMRVQVTSGALAVVNWIKRSALNTGGTATTPSGVPFDSADAAHAATLRLYSAIPSGLGTAVFTAPNHVVTTATTAVPAGFTSAATLFSTSHSPIAFTKPITLRGANESFCANFAGATPAAGFTAWPEITWTEQPV